MPELFNFNDCQCDTSAIIFFRRNVKNVIFAQHNKIIVSMIPNCVAVVDSPFGLLPPGIYDTDLDEIKTRYAVNQRRVELFEGMILGVRNLFQSGCLEIYLDGSYITTKPHPNDYEICWDPRFVDPRVLDPVFLKFDNERYEQKQKFLGEYFPTTFIEASSGKPFTEYFQTDRNSGKRKGILRVKAI